MNILLKIRDLWRGYSDKDIDSALVKINTSPKQPGAIVLLSNEEFKAYINKVIG